MPIATHGSVELYYERHGEGPPVVFVPTAGYGPWQWAWQYQAVVSGFSPIVYHGRGTGNSDAPAGPYTVAELADDLEAVLQAANARKAHAIGFGLGGMVALEHAHRYGRVRSLVLISTTPGGPEATRPTRISALGAPRDDRTALTQSLQQALSEEFRQRHPDAIEQIVTWRTEEDANTESWEAGAAAFQQYERDWPLYEMTRPTLVVHGTADAVVPLDNARTLATELPNGQLVTYPEAGHLVTVERSRPLNDRIRGTLEDCVASD